MSSTSQQIDFANQLAEKQKQASVEEYEAAKQAKSEETHGQFSSAYSSVAGNIDENTTVAGNNRENVVPVNSSQTSEPVGNRDSSYPIGEDQQHKLIDEFKQVNVRAESQTAVPTDHMTTAEKQTQIPTAQSVVDKKLHGNSEVDDVPYPAEKESSQPEEQSEEAQTQGDVVNTTEPDEQKTQIKTDVDESA